MSVLQSESSPRQQLDRQTESTDALTMPVSLILVKSGWENTQVSVKFGQQQYQPLIKFLPLCLCVCMCVFLTKCESLKNPPPSLHPALDRQLQHSVDCCCTSRVDNQALYGTVPVPSSWRWPVEQNSLDAGKEAPGLLLKQKTHYLAHRSIYVSL